LLVASLGKSQRGGNQSLQGASKPLWCKSAESVIQPFAGGDDA
jgi:hypothetical protein